MLLGLFEGCFAAPVIGESDFYKTTPTCWRRPLAILERGVSDISNQIVEWDNWIGHDLGRRAPQAYHYGRRKLLASYSHWRGLNMMRYLNGSVGPRPSFTLLRDFFGKAANAPGGSTMFGAYWVGGIRQVVLIRTDGNVYRILDQSNVRSAGNPGVWEFIGNLGFTPTCATVSGCNVVVGSTTVTVAGTPNLVKSAYIDPIAFTITPITGMPICDRMVAYNQFIVVGYTGAARVSGANPSLIYFSDLPTNIRDLPGLNWTLATNNGVGVVGVGTAEPISGLFTQKDTLVISKMGGEWWTLTGIPTTPPTIRRVDVGLDFNGVGSAVRQSSIWYPNGRDIGIFNGSATQIMELPDIDDFGGASRYSYNIFTGLSSLVNSDEFMLAGYSTNLGGQNVPWVFIRHGLSGIATAAGWSRHTIESLTGNVNAPTPWPVYVGDGITWLFVQSPASSINVYQFDIRQEIPYESQGTFPAGNPKALYADGIGADVPTGSFAIPEWWAPDGHLAHVTRVFVDLDYDAAAWQNASAAGTNPADVIRMAVNVSAINIRGDDVVRASQPLLWTPKDVPRLVSGSNTGMTRTRAVFRVGEQGPASGFQIGINNIRGIQIFRVLANVNVDLAEPF